MSDFQRDAAIVAAIGSGFIFLGKLLDRLFGWRRQRESFAERLRNEYALLQEQHAELRRDFDALAAKLKEEGVTL